MQSGITVDPTLIEEFRRFTSDSSLYGLTATIKSEKIFFNRTVTSPTALVDSLNPDETQYIVLKDPVSVAKSVPSSFPSEPLFAIAFIPPNAPIRSKTIFASSFLTFRRDLSSAAVSSFADTPFLNKINELSSLGWTQYAAHKAAPPPLSEKEKMLLELESAPVGSSAARMPLAGMAQMMGGIASAAAARAGSPGGAKAMKQGDRVGSGMDSQVETKLREFAAGKSGDWIQLVRLPTNVAFGNLKRINRAETVVFVDASSNQSATLDTVANTLSQQEPTYMFFRFHHGSSSDNSIENTSVVSISSIPSAAPVKDRMLHSCGKIGLNRFAEFEVGIALPRRIEASDRAEATELLKEYFAGPAPASKFRPKPKPKPSGFSSPNSGSGSPRDSEELVDSDDADAVLVSPPSESRSFGGGDPSRSSTFPPSDGVSPLADVLMGRRPKGPGRR